MSSKRIVSMLPVTSIKHHVSDTDTAQGNGKSNNTIIRFSALLGGGMLILGGLTTVNRSIGESYYLTHFSFAFPLGFAATCAGVNALDYVVTTKVSKFSEAKLIQRIEKGLLEGFALGTFSFLSGFAARTFAKLVPDDIAPLIKPATVITTLLASNFLTKIVERTAIASRINFRDISRIVWIGALQLGTGVAINTYLDGVPILHRFTYNTTLNKAAQGIVTGTLIAIVQAIALKIFQSEQNNKYLLRNLISSGIMGGIFCAVGNGVAEEIALSRRLRPCLSWVPPYLNRLP